MPEIALKKAATTISGWDFPTFKARQPFNYQVVRLQFQSRVADTVAGRLTGWADDAVPTPPISDQGTALVGFSHLQ
jgi:hypothetical protein